MKLGVRLGIGFAVIVALLAVIGIVGGTNLESINSGVDLITKDRYPKTQKVSDIIYNVMRATTNVRGMMIAEDRDYRARLLEERKESSAEINEDMAYLEKTIASAQGKEYLAQLQKARADFLPVLSKMEDLALVGKSDEARQYLDQLRGVQQAYVDALQNINAYQDKLMVDDAVVVDEEVHDTRNLIIIIAIIAAVLAIIISIILTRSITKPVSEAVDAANDIAKGNMDISLDTSKRDEIGELLRAMQQMAANIKSLVDETNQLATHATNGQLDRRADASQQKGEFANLLEGFNNTLDAVIGPLNVTAEYVDRISKGDIPPKITDEYKGDFNEIKNNLNQLIDSLNVFISQMQEMSDAHEKGMIDVRISEDDFQGAFRNMAKGVNGMVAEHIKGILRALEIVGMFGDGNFDEPLEKFPGKKAIINETIEKVRENIKGLIEEMNHMSREHDAGDIDVKIDASKFKGAYAEMAEGVNEMVFGHIEVKKRAMDVVKEYGQGNFDEVMEPLPGKKKFINDILDQLRDNLLSFNHELDDLIEASKNGQLERRGNPDQFKGDWAKLVRGINELIDAVLDPINEAADVMKQMSEGNLSVKVTGEYKGDHAMLKNAINTTVDLMPFNEAVKVLGSMSEGDLTKKMTGEYKGDALVMKNAVNETIDSMNEILSQVKVTVEEVTRGSMQVSDASTSLSQGATEQAASLEEITSSMAQIGSQTKLNAENANTANVLTNDAKTAAERGNSEMSDLNDAMSEITESSRNISKIIKVIDEIAFQTNLLALNAAVEAARAGRHGKGFAVVAEEVRNLAARSASAAKETSELIENSIKTVENGSSLAVRTGGALEDITNGAVKAADIVAEIATSSNEQAQGIAQINEGLGQIDRVTQTNTASAEESASAAEELSGQASQLKELISRFAIAEQYDRYVQQKMLEQKQEEDSEEYSEQEYSSKSIPEKKSRQLPESSEMEEEEEDYDEDFGDDDYEDKPEDIINLDEEDFGKY